MGVAAWPACNQLRLKPGAPAFPVDRSLPLFLGMASNSGHHAPTLRRVLQHPHRLGPNRLPSRISPVNRKTGTSMSATTPARRPDSQTGLP